MILVQTSNKGSLRDLPHSATSSCMMMYVSSHFLGRGPRATWAEQYASFGLGRVGTKAVAFGHHQES